MPDATITSTASTFGTITGTFAADQSTVTGTITGVVAGTLTGSVGVPGPAGAPGQGVPVGGTAGQFLTKIDGTNYNTDWTTVNLSAYAPLNSPAFTGDPTAPTAVLGDNDTSLATTAFVQQELLSGTANAKNLEVYVRNQTGSTLAAGAIVYINGATGNRPTVTLAQANNDANSAQTMGFVKTAIANNGFGFVIVSGECEGLNTSAVAEGTQLYLSPTVAGAYTTTKPVAPNHLVYVGIVIRSHPTQGVILVAVQNGYELNELHDVSAQTPANLDLLSYESSTSLWKNKTFSALGLLTSADAASTYQTLAGMSSYLTTASAASTYYPLVGNPSGFLTSVPPPTLTNLTSDISWDGSANTGRLLIAGVNDIGGGNTEARLNFTSGVPTQPATGDFWTNGTDFFYRESGSTKTIASQSYVSANYQPLSGMSSYLTTASAASTYFTIASAASKADLASPTFTGTPTLPTGTIAVTQSAGNNTTAVATTAFVQQEVPAASTTAASVRSTTPRAALKGGISLTQASSGSVNSNKEPWPGTELQRNRAAAVRAWFADLGATGYADLSDSDVRGPVIQMETATWIAAGRALQILDAPIQPGERP